MNQFFFQYLLTVAVIVIGDVTTPCCASTSAHDVVGFTSLAAVFRCIADVVTASLAE